MIYLMYGSQHEVREMSFQKMKLFMKTELIRDVQQIICGYLYSMRKDIFKQTHLAGNMTYRGLEYHKIDTTTRESHSQIQLFDNQYIPFDLENYYNVRLYQARPLVVNTTENKSYSVYFGCEMFDRTHEYMSEYTEYINSRIKYEPVDKQKRITLNAIQLRYGIMFIGFHLDTIPIEDILTRGKKIYSLNQLEQCQMYTMPYNFLGRMMKEINPNLTLSSFPKFILKFT